MRRDGQTPPPPKLSFSFNLFLMWILGIAANMLNEAWMLQRNKINAIEMPGISADRT